jgi:hypothetical protein
MEEGKMRKALLILLVCSFVFLGFDSQSQAGMDFGVKSSTLHNSLIPMDHSMGSYFGSDLGQNLVLLGGLDYGRLGVSVELSGGMVNLHKSEVSVSYLQPHAGLKMYFKPRAEGAVSPYLLGEVFKSFASVDLSGLGNIGLLDTESVDMGYVEDRVKDLLSPYGIVGGFGSEYYFSDAFGIGGEVGLQLAFTSTSSTSEGVKTKISLNRYFIYAAFSFNFKL